MSEVAAIRPNNIGAVEWDLRVRLAACYRIFDHLGWIELIFNHISMRVPGPEHHFLQPVLPVITHTFHYMYRRCRQANFQTSRQGGSGALRRRSG